MTNDRLHDLETAAGLLGNISRTTLFELLRAGQIGSVKLGRRRMIPQSQIDLYIQENTARQTGSLKQKRKGVAA